MVVILGFFSGDVIVLSGCDVHPYSVDLKKEPELCISV